MVQSWTQDLETTEVPSGRQAKKRRREAIAANARASALNEARKRISELANGFAGDLDELEGTISENPIALARVLDSRALRRAAELSEETHLLPAIAWRTGLMVGGADQVLERLGAPWHQREYGSTTDDLWLAELRRSLDGFARICWAARFGYTMAACALARRYLERWTFNLASTTGVSKAVDETDEAFIDRVWSVYSEMVVDRPVSAEWSMLSELLHGRSVAFGGNSRGVRIEFGMSLVDQARVHNLTVRVGELALRQARGAIDTAATDRGESDVYAHRILQGRVDALAPPPAPPDFLQVFYSPLDYAFVASSDATTYSEWGATYRRMVGSRKHHVDLTGFDSWMAIEERWARSIDEARYSFAAERASMGDRFDPDSIVVTLLRYRCIAEMADLTSTISQNGRSSALRAAAAALESAWVLWLQDVDDAMVCMRAALEATARARTHRTKPDRAARLESRGRSTSPHRWVEAAGWNRLAPFVRALGEFSHIQDRSRHAGSRDLLTQVQVDPIPGEEIHTARAHALERVATMLAFEVATSLESTHPATAAAFRSIVLDESENDTEAALNEWLERAMSFRDHDFGEGIVTNVVGVDAE
jgi:hypothetical protein